MRGNRTIHATTIAIDGRGILLRGPSGSGKSDLALRLIEDGAELVADDRTALVADDGALVAEAPKTLAGLLEIRGVGLISLPYRDQVEIALVADLAPDGSPPPPRLPEPEHDTLAGVRIPRIDVAAFEASAPAKLKLALRHGVGCAP